MLGAFGALALLLAALGTYGVLSYVVAQRRREIGIRIALGAERGRVLGLVMRQGLVMAGTGLADRPGRSVPARPRHGLAAFRRAAVGPGDARRRRRLPVVAAALACYIPARRATRVDPMVVLREE